MTFESVSVLNNTTASEGNVILGSGKMSNMGKVSAWWCKKCKNRSWERNLRYSGAGTHEKSTIENMEVLFETAIKKHTLLLISGSWQVKGCWFIFFRSRSEDACFNMLSFYITAHGFALAVMCVIID